eukprot:9178109-Pyramimonas_sp.AAC.1
MPLTVDEITTKSGQTLCHPVDVVDHKVQTWHRLWAPEKVDVDGAAQLFQKSREAPETATLPTIEVSHLGMAVRRMKPRAELGVDRLTPADVQGLPQSARAELVDFSNQVEEQLTWPWQLLVVEGRLLPKKAQGDRVIGLICMICRIWPLIREDTMKPWTAGVQRELGRSTGRKLSTPRGFPQDGT